MMIIDILIISMVFVLALYATMKTAINYEERQRKEFFKRLSQRHIYIGSAEDLMRLREWGESRAHE